MVWLWLIPICYFADMLIRYCGFTNTLRIELNLVAKHMLNPSTSHQVPRGKSSSSSPTGGTNNNTSGFNINGNSSSLNQCRNILPYSPNTYILTARFQQWNFAYSREASANAPLENKCSSATISQ